MKKFDDSTHDDAMLMVPPPGFKFIPRFETVCGKPGCFECFDIFCDRCESKDRRIIELEMRNNDLVKYITQLQGRIFNRTSKNQTTAGIGGNQSGTQVSEGDGGSNPFAYIQSPILYDPNLNLSYVATTTFAPAPHGDAS